MSGKHKHARKQPGTKTTVEDTAGKPPQDPPPPEKLKCFQDILDIVCGLSDEEWRALTSDAPHARSKAEFASLCTSIMISVGKSAVKSFLPTLIHTLGMEAVLTAEEQLRKRTQSESRSPSGQSTTPTKPAASSHDSDESTSKEIVDTIVESMDMLSSQRKKRSKSGFPSVVGNIFQTINEMVRKFVHLSKQAVKESSTELLSVDEDLRLQKQIEVDSRADEVIQNIVDPFQKEVPLNKSNSSENHEASPSSDQRNGRIEDSSHSTPDLKECEGNVLTAKSERFLSKATQVVSDLLVRSDRCSTSTSTGSSKEIHDAAVNIAETVVEALDKLVESSVIDSQSDSEAIIRSLEASTHTLNRSDISEGRVPSTSLFRRVRGYVQALFTSLKPDEQTAASIQEAPVSDLQRSKDHTVSQLDDLTITCTNNIIGEIVQLYHSAESESQSHVPAGDDECEAIHGIIQGLEELVKASSSSSKRASSGRDLGDRMDGSFSNLDSALKASSLPHAASSIHSAQRLFSAEFGSKATQTVKDVLLKTGGEFSTSVSTQSTEAFSLTDLQPGITERPSAAASSLCTKASSTAADMTEMFLNRLQRYRSSTPLQKSFLSASRSIYRGVHKKVFGFFLGLRESFSAQVEPAKGAELETLTSPRFKVDLDSFTDEVIVKIVELYKSELLLPKPSPSTLPQISHSMGLLSTFPSGHGSDEEDKVSKISSSASRQTSIRMITVKTKGIVNEAVQKVSHIALQRAAPKIAWDELSQCSLASTRGTSVTPVLSVSSTDSDNAAPATTVVDATDKTPVLSSSDSECSVVTVVKRVVDALDSGRSIKSIPLSSDMSDLKSEITASGIRQKPPQDDAQVYEAQYVWNEHKVRLDSCTDEIISKIVDLYCSEVSDVLSKESIQKLTSDSFRVLSKHLVHDALWKFVVPLPAEEPMNMPSATSADSDVLFRRSRLMKRLNFSACEIGSYVCTAFQGFLGSLHKSEDITSDSVRLFAQFRLFRGVRRKVTEVFSLLSTSDKSDISSTTNETEKYTVWTKSTRSTTPQSKPDSIYSSAVSERSSNQENGVILKKPSSAAEEITQHQFQRPSATNQLTPLITDEPTCFHEVGLRKCLGSRPGPSQACRSTSDSVMETWARNLLRDPIQVPLALVYPFVEESVKSLLLHCLSQNPALPNVTSPDQDMQGTSASFESQSRNSNKSSGFQCVSTKAACRSTSDSVMETWARNLLRDPIQVPLALVYPFVEESVKSLLLHCLSPHAFMKLA
ncbi:hypothetical protein SRHO_G00021670 [Serrasalmus rhombeus]